METPNYYAIIPADVRYSDAISANAKLLYGEITCLSKKEGYCFATNDYFAKLYKKDAGTISRWVSELVNAGFVTSVIDIEAGNKRRLRLASAVPKMAPIRKNADTPIRKNADTPIRKNAMVYNNTSNNNTSNKVVVVGDNDFSAAAAKNEMNISAPSTTETKTLNATHAPEQEQTKPSVQIQPDAQPPHNPFTTNVAAIIADREALEANRTNAGVVFGKQTEQVYSEAVLSTSAYSEQALRCGKISERELPAMLRRFNEWNAGVSEEHTNQAHYNRHFFIWLPKQRALLEKEKTQTESGAAVGMSVKDIAKARGFL